MVDFYKVPVYELNRIKNGADFVTPEGEVIPNLRLTRPSAPARKYAYCSDTIYRPSLAEQIKNVDLLFHEATFAQTEQARAKETYHTTAAQAAQLALDANVRQLVIGHFPPVMKMNLSYFMKRPPFSTNHFSERKFVY